MPRKKYQRKLVFAYKIDFENKQYGNAFLKKIKVAEIEKAKIELLKITMKDCQNKLNKLIKKRN
jgi:hypothetical protein